MRKIKLTQGFEAIIDDADYSLVSEFNWYPLKTKTGTYARGVRPGRQDQVYMHRILLKADAGEYVDHINGNGLDNRRCNLRLCTAQQNSWNSNKGRGRSKYRGVSWCDGTWSSAIKDSSGVIELGRFNREYDAAVTYDIAAKILRGEFARLNIPDADHPDLLSQEVIARLKRLRLISAPPIEIICAVCGDVFYQERRSYARNQRRGSVSCCSRKCRAVRANLIRHARQS